ncbi:DNA mismatch repair endonuclease MutL [Candidatus Peregrinibacteria bacterium]|nr:DNA mismatch repair endonuclease MutL [Candidatus Peregrinibacteria bacterium]
MSIIKLLPENLINQIAAGEVIERPQSVVKELIENSIDAGSDSIVVEIKNGGSDLISVKDNGIGMSEEDVEMALMRHATSKINNEDDLWNIASLGFRGEALASISSVSQMTIKSKTEDQVGGIEIISDGGKLISKKEVGMGTGTQIDVRALFFNTPARKKYLKKESTEFSHISYIVNTIALSNPGVAFKLVHNGKTVFDLPKVTDFISRISDVFGVATADAMLPIYYGGSELKIDGFIGKPAISRSNNKYQHFIVNGRPVKHYLFANIIKRAFHSMLMEGKQPVFFININIDPKLIDVNVHPRKLEIRFENEQDILKIIYGATKKALEKNSMIPKGVTESQRYMADSFPESRPSTNFKDYSLKASSGNTQEALDFTKKFTSEPRDYKPINIEAVDEQDSETEMTAIMQISASYIVASNEDGLVLIDQHAAHERVRYEQLMKQFKTQEKQKQALLLPQSIELSHEDAQELEENLQIFLDLGFEIENFGGKTYSVNAVPRFFVKEEIEGIILGVLDDISDMKKPDNVQGRSEEIINYMACRSAIKFGQNLTLAEMQKLLNDLNKLKTPYTCPHGRPTMISLTLDELEKMFGRK